VDIDAVAVAHATAILAGNDRAVSIRGDFRTPAPMLDAVKQTGLIDLSEPVGMMMVALLHLVPTSDQPAEAVAALRESVSPGSHLVISHLTSAERPDETARLSTEVAQRDRVSLVFRPRAEIEAFFGDFELLPPGLTQLSDWRPDPAELEAGSLGSSLYLAGVGRKN
jgi:hypothetical protein